ncbi:hypothetical protein [Lewinella sp. W8]|uniref:hypothetical protein n=1 Tax=Lewinella sp. W8 TaxID=2528208 RepID=UPI0010676ED3|nr:hypothetical protein [Lewinella sp. W8]MTB53853.1 hypothetical protein [Lewinella sp. W8]
MKFFLRLPSLLLSLITFGLSGCWLLLGLGIGIVDTINGESSYIESDSFIEIFFLLYCIGVICHRLWLLSGLHYLPKIQSFSPSPWTIFGKVMLIFNLLFFLLVLYFIIDSLAVTESIQINESESLASDQRDVVAMGLLLAVYPMASLIGIATHAYTLTQTEGKVTMRRSPWWSTFILGLIWPIGITFLQSRIKRILAGPGRRETFSHLVD